MSKRGIGTTSLREMLPLTSLVRIGSDMTMAVANLNFGWNVDAMILASFPSTGQSATPYIGSTSHVLRSLEGTVLIMLVPSLLLHSNPRCSFPMPNCNAVYPSTTLQTCSVKIIVRTRLQLLSTCYNQPQHQPHHPLDACHQDPALCCSTGTLGIVPIQLCSSRQAWIVFQFVLGL